MEAMTNSIVISAGHGKYVRGASGVLDEVDEARRVVDKVVQDLKGAGVTVKSYHDDVSKTQAQNLNAIVNFHNAQKRDLDVSIHFNSNGRNSGPLGTECLYLTQQSLARDVANAVSHASGLVNRGGIYRPELFFLRRTAKPSILIEVCFVTSRADAALYNQHFDAICKAIADTISSTKPKMRTQAEPERPKPLPLVTVNVDPPGSARVAVIGAAHDAGEDEQQEYGDENP
jgi:N-acetylmuramoyl-L-alanine amidase